MSSSLVNIYNPLGSHLPAYADYCTWRSQWGRRAPLRWLGIDAASKARNAGGADTSELLRRYQPHLEARKSALGEAARIALPDVLTEDDSEFARRARSYLAHVCAMAELPSPAQVLHILLPKVELFDARCLDINGTPSVFITSQAVELVRSFARTVSLCARLNMLATPQILEMAEQLPPCVLLAWETITGAQAPGIVLHYLLQLSPMENSSTVVRRNIFEKLEWLRPEEQRAQGWALLSCLLMQAMLQTVSNVLQGRPGVNSVLDAATDIAIAPSDRAIDSDYLALLILAFIVLHEAGHVVLGHNALEPVDTPMDGVYRELVKGAQAYANEHPDEILNFQSHLDSVMSHEIAADRFALHVAGDTLRHPLLEAATLWCAVLETADESREDWLEKFRAGKPGAHPPFMARVWQLNGQFSTGVRQGWPAQEITRRAQSMADRVGPDLLPADGLARIFPILWQIAQQEIRNTSS